MATVKRPLNPLSAMLHATGIAELVKVDGTNFPVFGYAFDAAADEQISFRFAANNYGSGNLTLKFYWYSRSGSTTGNAVFDAAIACVSDGDAQSMETDGIAAATSVTSAVNGTAKGPRLATITISNLDSIAADDSVELRFRRLGTNGSDTMAGDAIVFDMWLEYSDT